MKYNGTHHLFDPGKIKTYPLLQRINKVKAGDLITPGSGRSMDYKPEDSLAAEIDKTATEIVNARQQNKPVIAFVGAHLVKNGMGPLLVDLIDRKIITLVGGNGATAIHDFELALIGETSEYVPDALAKGEFGMAYEFSYINGALKLGNSLKYGFGESLGKMICDKAFFDTVLADVGRSGSPRKFLHPPVSILAACSRNGIPCTIHAGIGTDVIDQHPSFDGQAKGGCSGRDFLIFTHAVKNLADGGVVVNIGSAVTGPEVLLKAISMVANIGSVPSGIVTADFDLRNFDPELIKNENEENYYFRDQKSIVTRIPEAFGGQGFYIQGNHLNTIPYLYKKILEYS